MIAAFRSGLLQDRSRTDWDGTGARPISWSAWFPASVGEAAAPMKVGGPAEPWFDVGPVARDAALLSGIARWPVVLVSHGTGGTAASMGWIGRRLAEHGFVVLGPDHHGNTAVAPYRPEGFLCWWERACDLSILLDQMQSEGHFAGHLDTDCVFVVGFSLGCHAALSLLGGITDMDRFRAWAEFRGGPLARGPREFPDLGDRFPELMANREPFRSSWRRRANAYRDARIRAALLLAPAPPVRAFTEESLAGITAPVGIMIGGADLEAPARDGADWLAGRLAGAEVEHLGPAVGHYVFLPEGTEAGLRDAPGLCVDAPGVSRRAVHEEALAAALRLFGRSASTATAR